MWEKREGKRERGRKEGWQGEGEEEGGEGGRDRGNGGREREGSINSKPRKLSLIILQEVLIDRLSVPTWFLRHLWSLNFTPSSRHNLCATSTVCGGLVAVLFERSVVLPDGIGGVANGSTVLWTYIEGKTELYIYM